MITQSEVDKRNEQRKSWSVALNQLERKKAKELSKGLTEQADKRELKIEELKQKLDNFPVLEAKGIDESISYPHQELSHINDRAVEKLNITLNSHDGERIIAMLDNNYWYSDAVLEVWKLVRTRGIRLSIPFITSSVTITGFQKF